MMSFEQEVISFLRRLVTEPDPGRLPSYILQFLKAQTCADNVVLVGVQEGLLGNWWVRSDGSQITDHSMDIVSRALRNESGWCRGGTEEAGEQDPSESQVSAGIRSCIAARLSQGDLPLGAIYCDVRDPNSPCLFTDQDAEKLKMCADLFSVYFERFGMTVLRKEQQHSVTASIPLIGEALMMKGLKKELISAAKLISASSSGRNGGILLQGETGCGKEVCARTIHAASSRAKGPFVAVNAAEFSPELLESELFGCEKGAFTGAVKKRQGLIELAEGGTFFLDEVGEMPEPMQAKLLRTIDERTVRPVGANIWIKVNFCLICATNRPLKEMSDDGRFKKDLFYRISGMRIWVPSLKERIDDIPLLAAHFANQGTYPKRLSDDANVLLKAFDWPGNVRQLRSVVEQARDLAEGPVIQADDIKQQLRYQGNRQEAEPAGDVVKADFCEIRARWKQGQMSNIELESILAPLYLRSDRNVNEVARVLGCKSKEEIKEFRNFLYALKRKGEIRLG